MAKAQITTPQGVTVKIDGTPTEITALVRDLTLKAARPSGRQRGKAKPSRVLLVDLIASLVDGGFFKKPRDLGSIKATLEEMGHHYPVTTLSPTMLRLVRRHSLRRIRAEKRWAYVR